LKTMTSSPGAEFVDHSYRADSITTKPGAVLYNVQCTMYTYLVQSGNTSTLEVTHVVSSRAHLFAESAIEHTPGEESAIEHIPSAESAIEHIPGAAYGI
jgi:hypothetical protein